MSGLKKAIFGGTFDPIHNGHIYLAYEALELLKLDKVIFVPSGNPPHKTNKIITDALIRCELVKSAIINESKFEMDSIEVNNSGLSYTYKTLEYFNQLEKTTEWYFLTGSDCLMDLHYWKNVSGILELCNFVVFNRPGFDKNRISQVKLEVEKKYNKEIILLQIEPLDISSTMIRQKVKNNEEIEALVSKSVEASIRKLGLYKEENINVD
ncbi:MAG: nicotinate-nucleotide adenylyltransferase [Clostridiaceae bacterium]|nr:nicotinate-nucleotide adenylyltransferase [Clostridiaceae bacterium]